MLLKTDLTPQPMYISAISHYLPKELVGNSYFEKVNGLSDEWIYSRTGIKTRTRVSPGENTNTMAVEAVRELVPTMGFPVEDIDLIVGATYSPFDTVGTLAHVVQREFGIKNAIAFTIDSACSSLINAFEVVEGLFVAGKAGNALVVASEQNSLFSNETDQQSGHLWGDGAAAIYISKHPTGSIAHSIEAIYTAGLGHVGKGPEGVRLHPKDLGLIMPHGKDVFMNACNYMIFALKEVLTKKHYSLSDVSYLIPHQANIRIIQNIAEQLNFDPGRVFTNIEELGNTGCASTAIAYSQNLDRLRKNDLVAFTVFGGGYSCGAMLVRIL